EPLDPDRLPVDVAARRQRVDDAARSVLQDRLRGVDEERHARDAAAARLAMVPVREEKDAGAEGDQEEAEREAPDEEEHREETPCSSNAGGGSPPLPSRRG